MLRYIISDLYLLWFLEILGFKLKNKNDKNNSTIEIFDISPMLIFQFKPNFRHTNTLTLVIILLCQTWIVTESESVNFLMYGHNRRRPGVSLYTKYYNLFLYLSLG